MPARENLYFPSGFSLIAATREEIFELCRLLMVSTACGDHPFLDDELRIVLPGLAVDYACASDFEGACTVLRACAYIGVGETTACRWAAEWILDQQQADGRFGFSGPGMTGGCDETERWLMCLVPTVSAVWSLAELCRPAFMLGKTMHPASYNGDDSLS